MECVDIRTASFVTPNCSAIQRWLIVPGRVFMTSRYACARALSAADRGAMRGMEGKLENCGETEKQLRHIEGTDTTKRIYCRIVEEFHKMCVLAV